MSFYQFLEDGVITKDGGIIADGDTYYVYGEDTYKSQPHGDLMIEFDLFVLESMHLDHGLIQIKLDGKPAGSVHIGRILYDADNIYPKQDKAPVVLVESEVLRPIA